MLIFIKTLNISFSWKFRGDFVQKQVISVSEIEQFAFLKYKEDQFGPYNRNYPY